MTTAENDQEIQPKPAYVRPPWWKRRYVVNRDFQMRFAWSAVVVGLVSSTVSSFMILLAFWSFNIWQGQRLPLPVMVTILVVMITNVAGIYVVTVLTTQKIAGPLFNMLRQFDQLATADFKVRLRFRRRDELQYVADRFNQMAEKLERRDQEILTQLQKIHSQCRTAGEKDATGTLAHVSQEIERLLTSQCFAQAVGAARLEESPEAEKGVKA